MNTPADLLQLSGKSFLVFGVANRKSVAYAISQVLEGAGAEVVYVVRNEQQAVHLTSITGHSARWATFWLTLPSRSPLKEPSPREPMTMRSAR